MAEASNVPDSLETVGKEQNKDLTVQVADHYNKLKESGVAERTNSRIFYLRNFNNWIKSMAIAEYLSKLREEKQTCDNVRVLDLCSGKGGDLLKWKKGAIDSIVCADIASTSVEQCEIRYKEMKERSSRERNPSKTFKAQFIAADCTKQRLQDLYELDESRDTPEKFNLVSCQFSFHYSFESLSQAHMMLRNACECLQVGGYFIGTTPNSYELVKRLRKAEGMSFGNDVYSVTFKTENKENIALFGAQYDFHLEGVVDCPEFVVYFPLLEKLAEEYGMELQRSVSFAEYFRDQLEESDGQEAKGRGLIGRMQALEPYPPDKDVELMGKEDTDYCTIRDKMSEVETQHGQRGKPLKFGTLSKAEWEAATIYLLFAFKKIEDKCPPMQTQNSDPSSTVVEGDQATKRQTADSQEPEAELSPDDQPDSTVCPALKRPTDSQQNELSPEKRLKT